MDKETKALIEFYDNKIKELENKNKEKQDKLDEIVEYLNFLVIFHQTINGKFSETIWGQEILELIKGEDK